MQCLASWLNRKLARVDAILIKILPKIYRTVKSNKSLYSLGLQEMFMEIIINSRIREEKKKYFQVKSPRLIWVINSCVVKKQR